MPDGSSLGNLTPQFVGNAWRHYWARLMRECGGQSTLPLEPLDWPFEQPTEPSLEVGHAEPDPEVETEGKPPELNRAARRSIAKHERIAKRPRQPRPSPKAPFDQSVDLPSNKDQGAKPVRVTKDQQARPIRVRSRSPKKEQTYEEAAAGLFNYDVAGVLDCLDDYFVWIKRLKRNYQVGYDYHSRVGGVVVPAHLAFHAISEFSQKSITGLPADPKLWPAQMMISLPSSLDDDKNSKTVAIKLYCFCKITAGDFAPLGKIFYEGLAWANTRDDKSGALVYFGIGVDDDGRIRALPTKHSRTQIVLSKRYGTTFIHHPEMGFPEPLKSFAALNNRLQGESLSVDQHVAAIFALTLSGTLAIENGASINVSKRGMVGRFGIPAKQISWFFRDREPANPNLRRKAIFHPVEEYSYQRNGKEVTVGAHYRGLSERRFSWRGYDICITVPKFHHLKLSSFDSSAVNLGDLKDPSDAVGLDDIGQAFHDHVWQSRDRPRQQGYAPLTWRGERDLLEGLPIEPS
jgi:hypothetical protein